MYRLPLTTDFTVDYDDPDNQSGGFWVYRCPEYEVRCVPCASGYDVELYDSQKRLIGSQCTQLTVKELQLSTSVKLWELKRRLYTKLLWEWSQNESTHQPS